jgi:hypothetical protein
MHFTLPQAAEPGTVLVASGAATNTVNGGGVATIAGGTSVGASGVYPIGLLLNHRESFNYGKEYERLQYDTDDVGTVVSIVTDGEVITDMVLGTVVPGQKAYLAAGGKVSAVNPVAPADGDDWKVGSFISNKDSAGFVKLNVELA